MIHLILLRHAKSSWVNPDVDDFDRPLNKRGKRSARAIGKWLRAEGWAPDTILCSAARRTCETWEGLGLGGEADIRRELYNAGPDVLFKAIHKAPGSARTILLIAHNPGIAALAHSLVATPPEHPRFSDYPTGAMLIAGFDVKKPSKIVAGTGVVTAFLTPHDLSEPDS